MVAGKNGQLVGECEGVDVDVFPSVTLAGPGDEVTIATPVLFLPGPLEACPTDPLPELFQSESLLAARPDPAQVTQEWARAKGTVQAVDPYLIEKHLMTDGGIPSEVRQDVARKLVEAIRERLSAAGDRCDPIQAVADAQAPT